MAYLHIVNPVVEQMQRGEKPERAPSTWFARFETNIREPDCGAWLRRRERSTLASRWLGQSHRVRPQNLSHIPICPCSCETANRRTPTTQLHCCRGETGCTD